MSRPVFAGHGDATAAEAEIDLVRHDAFTSDERVGARRHAACVELSAQARPEEDERHSNRGDEDENLCGDAVTSECRNRGHDRTEADEDGTEMWNRHFDDRCEDGERHPDELGRVERHAGYGCEKVPAIFADTVRAPGS